jgi:transcriptional regulator with PAS, ATPase and Fis domain
MHARRDEGSAIRPNPAPGGPPPLLGVDPALHRVLETALRLARGEQPILVSGETGTGKELIARSIHAGSRRADGPFRAVNCAALPAGLLEAELFGAVRGAYTGADADRPGLLEAARGGTLFLDEIGDMPPPLQALLLRVLEDGLVRRVGSVEERRADFRLVAATHRDLARGVAEGRFREDLFWRLGRAIRLPPLRERPGDVLLLARAFLVEAADGGPPLRLDAGSEAWLLAHRFPGNVRELRSRILAAASLARDGTVRREDLADEDGGGGAEGPGPAEAPPREGRLLATLRAGGGRTVADLVRATGVPRRSLQRTLADLVRDGGLVRSGRGPATRYAVREDRFFPRDGGFRENGHPPRVPGTPSGFPPA